MLFNKLIILEDDDLIFINKPAGISSLDERNSDATSVIRLAKNYCPNAQLCHRLDKETSGVMIIAKNNETYKEINLLFENRTVKKEYHAILNGTWYAQNVEINLPLAQTKSGLAKVDFKEGKPSVTIVNTIQNFRHFTLLSCLPLTGRLHQIRIHLAAQNYPIVNDIKYNGKPVFLSELKKNYSASKFKDEEPIIKRFALHAFSISFNTAKKQYHVEAPYPKDFAVLLKHLHKFDL